jgi:hypothetical protein
MGFAGDDRRMRHSLPEPVLDETAFVSFGPIIEPPFADAHPGEVSAVLEDVRDVMVQPWDPPLTEELARRALAVATESAELTRELEGTRYEVIGVGLVDGKHEPARPVVVVYRYGSGRLQHRQRRGRSLVRCAETRIAPRPTVGHPATRPPGHVRLDLLLQQQKTPLHPELPLPSRLRETPTRNNYAGPGRTKPGVHPQG